MGKNLMLWILILLLPFCLFCGLFRSVTPPQPSSASTLLITTPTHTKTIPPSPSATNTPILELPFTPTSSGPFPRRIVPSLDGKYLAKYYDEFPKNMIQRIVIEDQSGVPIQVVEFIIDNPLSAPRPNLAIYQWSNDSTKLYFYNSFGFDGGGQPNLWNGYHLQSIDIETGEINEILPPEDLAAFALSPDQTQLAYALDSDQPRKVRVRDLDSGYEISALVLVPIPEVPGSTYTQIGKLSWSPSGKSILVHGSSAAAQYLYLFDLERSWVILLFEYWEYEFDPWLDEGLIRYITYYDEVFEYNLISGETTLLGTATPEP